MRRLKLMYGLLGNRWVRGITTAAVALLLLPIPGLAVASLSGLTLDGGWNVISETQTGGAPVPVISSYDLSAGDSVLSVNMGNTSGITGAASSTITLQQEITLNSAEMVRLNRIFQTDLSNAGMSITASIVNAATSKVVWSYSNIGVNMLTSQVLQTQRMDWAGGMPGTGGGQLSSSLASGEYYIRISISYNQKAGGFWSNNSYAHGNASFTQFEVGL